jgi:PKD repeat protein
MTSFARDISSGSRTDGGTANGSGLSGSVILTIAPGVVLTEQIEFKSITGASATRTITIKGNMSILQFDATTSTSKHTIWMNGAKYFTIDSLDIRANAPIYAWGIRFSNSANFNTISNCKVIVPNIVSGVGASTTSTSTQAAICFNNSSSILDYTANSSTSSGTNGNNNKIIGCVIGGSDTAMGPTYGIFDIQTSTTGNNSYINNKIQNFYQEGITVPTTDGITITGNEITRLGNNLKPTVIMRGIYLLNNVRATTKPITVTNNSIHDLTNTTTLYGFYHINSDTYIPNDNGGSMPAVFSNNKIYNLSTTSTMYIAYFSSIRNSGGYTIKNNEIFKNSNTSTMYCFYHSGLDKSLVDGNIVRSNKATTIYCMYDLTNTTNSSMINNLIFKNVATSVEYGMRLNGTGTDWVGNNYSNNTIAFDSSGWTSGTTYGMYIDGGVGFPNTNNKVFNNNIFIGHKGSSSTVLKYGIYNIDGYSGYTEAGNNVFFDTVNVKPATTYYGTEYSSTLVQIANLADWINLGFSNRDLNENPKFVNSYYGDYRINNPKLFKAGVNAGVVTDIRDIRRNPGSPDIGAFENPFNLSFSSVNLTKTTLCSGAADSIKFTINNPTAYTFKDLQLGILVNGVPFVIESVPVVNQGVTTYTFIKPLQISALGNKTLKFFSVYPDGSTSDDTITKLVNVIASPGGGVITLKPGSKGHFNHALGYDVTAFDEPIVYNLSKPRAYTDLEYGTKWNVQTWAVTSAGVQLSPTTYTVAHPSTTELTFKPSIAIVDKFVTLYTKVNDLTTGCDTVYKRTIFIAPKANIRFTVPQSVCFLTDVDFVNNSTISSGDLTYTWDFGDGSDIYVGKFAKHDYAAVGKYTVTLTATSTPFGYVKDTTFEVDVNEIPKANFTKVNACEGNNVVLTNTSKVNAGTPVYTWDFGDGTPTSNATNVSRAYAQAGVYKVTLTASKDGCEHSVSKTVYQFARPKADFVKSAGECINSPISFSNASTLSIGQGFSLWDFNDAGNTSTDASPTYSFTTAGNKNVKLVYTSEFGCKDSITKVINVKQAPITDFTNPAACDASPTTFTNTSNLGGEPLLNYAWDFGDGTTSSATSPIKNWTSAGIRTVKLKTTLANGCTSEVSKVVEVGVQPDVDFNLSNVCSGSPVNFENLTDYNPSKIIYSWSFGDGDKSSDNSPTHVYNTASSQTYTVKLKGSVINGCSDSVSKTITITALPNTCNFDINGNINSATKTTYSFVPTGGSMNGITYTWVTGDGNTVTSSGEAATYNYFSPGIFCVKMIATNVGGCKCEATKCITLTTDVNDVESMNNALSIYPNPSNGNFTVKFDAEVNGQMNVQVYNAVGLVVKTVSVDGNNTNIDLSEFASGVYVVKVSADNYTATKKVTLTK